MYCTLSSYLHYTRSCITCLRLRPIRCLYTSRRAIFYSASLSLVRVISLFRFLAPLPARTRSLLTKSLSHPPRNLILLSSNTSALCIPIDDPVIGPEDFPQIIPDLLRRSVNIVGHEPSVRKALANEVFPTPGTSSMSTCPPDNRAIMILSITSPLPTIRSSMLSFSFRTFSFITQPQSFQVRPVYCPPPIEAGSSHTEIYKVPVDLFYYTMRITRWGQFLQSRT